MKITISVEFDDKVVDWLGRKAKLTVEEAHELLHGRVQRLLIQALDGRTLSVRTQSADGEYLNYPHGDWVRAVR